MSGVAARLAELGLVLPPPLVMPGANRRPATLHGQTLYLSGHGSALLEDETVARIGRLGADLVTEHGYKVARALGLKMLATAQAALGDLQRVTQVVKLTGFVLSTPEFEEQNKVINGASDLMVEAFGPEIGVHARSSIGVAALVAGQSVEIEAIFAVQS